MINLQVRTSSSESQHTHIHTHTHKQRLAYRGSQRLSCGLFSKQINACIYYLHSARSEHQLFKPQQNISSSHHSRAPALRTHSRDLTPRYSSCCSTVDCAGPTGPVSSLMGTCQTSSRGPGAVSYTQPCSECSKYTKAFLCQLRKGFPPGLAAVLCLEKSSTCLVQSCRM